MPHTSRSIPGSRSSGGALSGWQVIRLFLTSRQIGSTPSSFIALSGGPRWDGRMGNWSLLWSGLVQHVTVDSRIKPVKDLSVMILCLCSEGAFAIRPQGDQLLRQWHHCTLGGCSWRRRLLPHQVDLPQWRRPETGENRLERPSNHQSCSFPLGVLVVFIYFSWGWVARAKGRSWRGSRTIRNTRSLCLRCTETELRAKLWPYGTAPVSLTHINTSK